MAKTVRTTGGRLFTVVLRAEDVEGYSVQCVEIPQAISQGETKEEALSNIREAIELVLEHLEEKAGAQNGKPKNRSRTSLTSKPNSLHPLCHVF